MRHIIYYTKYKSCMVTVISYYEYCSKNDAMPNPITALTWHRLSPKEHSRTHCHLQNG